MIRLRLDQPLEEQLGCFGYFGFGGGVGMAALPPADDDRGLYCNRCPRGPACWKRHQARVRTITPDLCALADHVAKHYRGARYFRELAKRTGQTLENLVEPYASVMMGNLQDGATVAHEGQPLDRGPGTLTWPLEPLEELPS